MVYCKNQVSLENKESCKREVLKGNSTNFTNYSVLRGLQGWLLHMCKK